MIENSELIQNFLMIFGFSGLCGFCFAFIYNAFK